MNAKIRREVEKRIKSMPEIPEHKLKTLQERIERNREKYGIIEHRGIFGNILKLFK